MLIPHNVFHVHAVAAEGSLRFATQCVFVTRTADGPQVAATDSRRLIIVRWPDDSTWEERYPAEGVGSVEHREGFAALIPVAPWREAGDRAAKVRSGHPWLKAVLCDETAGPNVAALGVTDLDTTRVIRPRQIEGRFPNYREILPDTSKGYAKVTVGARLFAELLTTIAKIKDADDDAVTIWFPTGKGFTLRIETENDRGHKIEGLLCLISTDTN